MGSDGLGLPVSGAHPSFPLPGAHPSISLPRANFGLLAPVPNFSISLPRASEGDDEDEGHESHNARGDVAHQVGGLVSEVAAVPLSLGFSDRRFVVLSDSSR